MRKDSIKPPAPITDLGKLGNRHIRINMTPNEAFELMQKLTTDDKFRARLTKNPRKELAKYHIYLPLGQAPTSVKLPPKSTLKKALDKATIGSEFKTETAALAAAAAYAWFHAVFTGYRFGLVATRATKPRRKT